MDNARRRFKENVELLTKHDPALAVMGDRDWTNACDNEFIQRMAKKLWLFDYTEHDVELITKAVKGYLKVLEHRAKAQPVERGNRIVKGEITSLKKSCDHPDCRRHWYMNVRDQNHSLVYTPIPDTLLPENPKDLVGQYVEFYAFVTVSVRDHTFGFAHRPKLMTIKEDSHAH